ncbi:hypothetical protein PG994_000504 [Apiospora phragmitis]|uniref:Uncharacterized protein n=1 Tax=Apiospora phragmitis TaxID=2905665 RepID=A0ABR1X6G6_9PEZI
MPPVKELSEIPTSEKPGSNFTAAPYPGSSPPTFAAVPHHPRCIGNAYPPLSTQAREQVSSSSPRR